MGAFDGSSRLARLTSETLLPIGMVVGIMSTFILATWWLRGSLSEINYSTHELGDRIGRIEQSLRDQSSDRVTKDDLRTFALMLKGANPTLNLPDMNR